MTTQEEINSKQAVIEELRKDKESIKHNIEELQYQLQLKDITIRDLRQSVGSLQKQLEQEEQDKVNITTVQQAREILDKYQSEYEHAKQVFFKVNKANQTIKELS